MFILRLIGSANRRRLHRIARRYFGLQITTVPERRFDMWHYEMNITSLDDYFTSNKCLRNWMMWKVELWNAGSVQVDLFLLFR